MPVGEHDAVDWRPPKAAGHAEEALNPLQQDGLAGLQQYLDSVAKAVFVSSQVGRTAAFMGFVKLRTTTNWH